MPLLQRTALLIGIALVTGGLLFYPPWAPQLAEVGMVSLPRWIAAMLIGALLARVLRRPVALGFGAVLLLTMLYFHGLAVVAIIALLLAGIGIGSLIVPTPALASMEGRASDVTIDDSPWFAMLIGSGMLMGALAWLLAFPIFSQRALVGVLLVIYLFRHRQIAAHLRHLSHTLTAATRESPKSSAATVAVLWLACIPAWLPVMSADDIAFHLQLGWQLQTLGYYRMDVGSQIWSLAPWLADVHYGVLQVLAGREGVGALNAAWLTTTAWLLVRLGQTIGLRGALPWVAAMLYISLPIVSSLTMGMQTETFSALLVAALGLLIMRAPTTADRGTLLCAIGLAAMLIGSKILNLAFVGPLGLLLLWRWRGSVPWRAVPASLALALLIGGASYTYAWVLAGNPILPLYNSAFASPWAPIEDLVDPRWHHGVSLATPFWLTFDAASYHEAGLPRGAGGLALILLAFGCIGAAVDPRLRGLLVVGLAAWLLPLSQVQYLRYTVPALTLLIPVLLAGVAMSDWRRLTVWACAAVALLQLALQPSASWVLAAGATSAYVPDDPSALLDDFAPERVVAEYWRQKRSPADRVLIATPYASAHAEFSGAAFVTTWYDPTLADAVKDKHNPADAWRDAVEKSGSNYLLLRRDGAPAGLHEYLAESGAALDYAVGAAWLYRLPTEPELVEVVTVPDGHVSLRYSMQEAGPHIVNARVTVSCSRPFEPFGVNWISHRGDRPPRAIHWAWQVCPASGRAEISIALSLPSGWSPLMLDVNPITAESEQRLGLISQEVTSRLDLSRERELSQIVRNAVCRRWRMCRELDGARLYSVSQ